MVTQRPFNLWDEHHMNKWLALLVSIFSFGAELLSLVPLAQAKFLDENSLRLNSQGGDQMSENDLILLPDPRREFVSPNGGFSVIVEATKPINHASTISVSLRAVDRNGQSKLLWTHPFSRQFGPRFVVVTNAGAVFLFDQTIQVIPKIAVVVYDQKGEVLVEHALLSLCDAARLSLSDVVRKARYGAWISEGPILSTDGVSISFSMGGVRVTLHAQTGRVLIK